MQKVTSLALVLVSACSAPPPPQRWERSFLPLAATTFDFNTTTPTSAQLVYNVFSTGETLFVTGTGTEFSEPWVLDDAGWRQLSAPLGSHLRFFQKGPDGAAYFHGDDGTWGVELWRSDGTTEGTWRITDCAEGGESTFPMIFDKEFALIDGGAVFACRGPDGREPHLYDLATREVRQIRDLLPGDSNPRWFSGVGNRVFFAVWDRDAGVSLPFVTDGTAIGTFAISDGSVEVAKDIGNACSPIGAVGDHAFFKGRFAPPNGLNTPLYVSDGTMSGTRLLNRDVSWQCPAWQEHDGRLLYFGSTTLKALDIDGGLTDLGIGTPFVMSPAYLQDPEFWLRAGSRSWLAARYYNVIIGTNGQPDGSVVLPATSTGVGAAAAKVVFTRAFNGNWELCASDGTVPCEVLSIVRWPADQIVQHHEGAVAVIGWHDLWYTDGTPSGTRLLPGFVGNEASSKVAALAAGDAGLFVGAFDGTSHGLYLVTDSQASRLATVPMDGGGSVRDISLLDNGVVARVGDDFMQLDGGGFFGIGAFPSSRTIAVNGHLLGVGCETGVWSTDGTQTGTRVLLTGDPDAGCFYSGLARDTTGVYFEVPRARVPELAWSNGTSIERVAIDANRAWNLLLSGETHAWFGAAQQVGRITRLDAGSFEVATLYGATVQGDQAVEWRGDLFFSGVDNGLTDSGMELFRTTIDGGIQLLADIFTGRTSSGPADFVIAGSRLYFSAVSKIGGRELWSTDGTTEGTRMVVDLWPGTTSGYAGPALSLDFSGAVIFAGRTPDSGVELWRTNGTPSGTRQLTEIGPGTRSSWPRDLARSGPWLYFTATGDGAGRELRRLKVAVVTDDTPPTLACVDQQLVQLASGDFPPFASPAAADDVSAAAELRLSLKPAGVATLGRTSITATAVDEAGNTATCTFTVAVTAAAAPAVACPDDLQVETSGVTAIVNWVPARPLPDVSVIDQPPSGSTFGLGETTVTRTATNRAGSQSECRFSVGVTRPAPRPPARCGCESAPAVLLAFAMMLLRLRRR